MNWIKLVSIATAVCLLSFIHSPAQAVMGDNSILKINNESSKAYYDSGTTTGFFGIPWYADLAPQNYMLNKPIKIEIDRSQLPIHEIFEKTIVVWDFGDGSPAQKIINGNKNTYTYTRTGTFIISTTADYTNFGFSNVPQPIKTVLVNIIPNKEYLLPKAVIKIDNQLLSQDGKKRVSLDLNNPISFDGSESKPGSAKIVEYKWNFGQDNEESDKDVVQFRYKLPLNNTSLALRVKDENGLFSDATVKIVNVGKNEPSIPEKVETYTKNNNPLLLELVGATFIISTICCVLIIRFLRKKRSHHNKPHHKTHHK